MRDLKSLKYYYLSLYRKKFPHLRENTSFSPHSCLSPSTLPLSVGCWVRASTSFPLLLLRGKWVVRSTISWALSHIMRIGITLLKGRSQLFPSHCLGPSFAWWVGLWDFVIDKVLLYQVSSPTGKSLSSDFWGGKKWEPQFDLGCKLHSPSKSYP